MSQTDEDVEDLPTDTDGEELDEEGDEEGDEEEEEEDEDKLSIYDASTFISEPYQNEFSTLPEDILKFDFSYGYDCRRYFNLTVADPDTLVFASGNLINFFGVESKTISFRRSALGGGIGHIKTNPNPEHPHIAVAENGSTPLIIIYEWPEMEINCVLRGGSSKIYTFLDYSPDGELLVSQGGEPDYLITVWNWPKRKILLRTKSYVNDVFRVKFSPYVPGHLTSCGISHIKFWKMARTFTGLKLKGELGRFGKTEFSDIIGILPMPDEKVVSGCSWGNILIWDAGLIKLEVFRSLRRKCHDAPIVQVHFDEGELWTVSMDGHVRVWWYEKIDQADPPDDDRVVQIEPTYDFYTAGLMLMCLKKRYPDPLDTTYFGQDGNGGIWIIDLNTEDNPRESIQLYKSHAGGVADLAACPWGKYFATLGMDGRFYLYEYLAKKLIFEYRFPVHGTCMIWFPSEVSKYLDELVMGFDDGTLRVCVLAISDESKISLTVTQTVKPHSKSLTKVTVNSEGNVLVTGGEDSTIFIFQIINAAEFVSLVPIGFISVPNVVTYLTWHHLKTDELLVACNRGEFLQVEVPREPQLYTKVSFVLDLKPRTNRFVTYKAQIRRDIRIREIEASKAKKVERKRVEMERIKAENPGLDIDEEIFLADSDSEEELEPLFIPEIPNKILWLQTTDDDTIWLSMGGYDAGYIYEYKIDQTGEVPYGFRMVDHADDVEISSFVYNHDKSYLIFAMQDGEIRVNRITDGDFRDLSDYWALPMHDNLNGFVPKMSFSFDERYFFTCGHDGNVFAFAFNPEDDNFVPDDRIPRKIAERDSKPIGIPDEPCYDKLSIEEVALKQERDRIERLANANKDVFRGKIKKLGEKFQELLNRNRKLLLSQIIPKDELELDERITEYLDKKLNDQLELVKRKLAYDVEKSKTKMSKLRDFLIDPLDFFQITVRGINSDVKVQMSRQRKIAEQHDEMLNLLEEKLLEDALKGRSLPKHTPHSTSTLFLITRLPNQTDKELKTEHIKPPERPPPVIKPPPPKIQREDRLEYFLISLSPSIIEMRLGTKLTRILTKYRMRRKKWEKRHDEWEEFLAKKPLKGVNHPEDESALAEAKLTIGDYKLKSSEDYKVAREQRETTVKKYKQLLETRVKQFSIRNDFNKKVSDLRMRKVQVREELRELQQRLDRIHREIPQDEWKSGPEIDPEDSEEEFPERNLEINVALVMDDEKDEEIPKVIVPEPSLDLHEFESLPEDRPITLDVPPKYDYITECDFDDLMKNSERDQQDTLWESEIRYKRLQRKFYEQDETIAKSHQTIQDFNDKVAKLRYEKFQVETDGKFIDLFILTLHQELLILKDFEAIEDALQEKVNQKTSEVLDMTDSIHELNEQIVEHNKQIENLNDKAKSIQDTFQKAVTDNKFFDFLRRVFKKKYKPPKVHTDDESSSESSSSSSSSSEEDDDGGSIDSRDFGIIRQDLNVCPKGCDPALYELTVSLRTQRHQVELQVKEEIKTIDLLKKDLEMQNKKVKFIEKVRAEFQLDLEKYQREKQQKLNEVRCTVVMKLNQFQHLNEEGKTSIIEDTLIFSKSLLSRLYKRVDELQVETDRQKSKHLVNVKHLTRMRADCKFMATQIHSMKGQIVAEMQIKFGKVIDLDEIEEAMLKRTFGEDDLNDLEEVVLKKLVHDLRLSLIDIRGMYVDEMKLWRDKVDETQDRLKVALQDNTSRHQLLTLLNKEKTELSKEVKAQDKKREHLEGVKNVSESFKEEIAKLDAVLREQIRQIQELKDEIKMLKTKGLPPRTPKPESGDLVKDWDKFEEFMDVEEEEEIRPFSKDILIPSMTSFEKMEAMISDILNDMLEALDVELSSRSTENFIKQTLNSVLTRVSVTEILHDLLGNLPIEPDEEQKGIIQSSAERLYTMQEPEVTAEEAYAMNLLDELLDEVILTKEGPSEMISSFVTKIVNELPLEFILKRNSLEVIAERLLNSALGPELDKIDLKDLQLREDAELILKEILNTVYAIGIDYLYYID